jgi:hypothetical protein
MIPSGGLNNYNTILSGDTWVPISRGGGRWGPAAPLYLTPIQSQYRQKSDSFSPSIGKMQTHLVPVSAKIRPIQFQYRQKLDPFSPNITKDWIHSDP